MRTFPTAICLVALVSIVGCQTPAITPVKEGANWKPDPTFASTLGTQENGGNGIEVGEPKVYDDASLRLMLDASRATLATMTGLSQSALTSSLGSLSGETISQTQFGLQVGPGALPSTSNTFNSPTTSTTTNAQLPATNSTVPGTVTVTTAPSGTSTVTTTPTAPTLPTVASGIAFTPASGVSPSSIDMLNEQMQLNSAITSYELLLEGALSDRFLQKERLVKPRATLGFPISLRPPASYKDCVAVVEVEAQAADPALDASPPSVTVLLPQEKSYNVAAMTDHMNSIGAGAVVGTVGVGVSGTWGHKSLFLVQDQDTVAFQRAPGNDPNTKHATARFLWEFRPVLGQHYVRGEMKQTFVQLAFAVRTGVQVLGEMTVRTYWRRFNRDNGIVGDVIPDSVLVSKKSFEIPKYDLAPQVASIAYDDLGDGTLAVHVRGSYLSGTYAQFGSLRFEVGKNLIVEDTGARFVLPVSALAQWTGQMVARSGAYTPLLQPEARANPHNDQSPASNRNSDAVTPGAPSAQGTEPTAEDSAPTGAPQASQEPPDACPHVLVRAIDIRALDETNSALDVELDRDPELKVPPPLLLAVGTKVFGLRDAPLWRYRAEKSGQIEHLVATVPTAALVANPTLRVFVPFYSDVSALSGPQGASCPQAQASRPLSEFFGPSSATEHLVLLSVAKNGDASFILYGNGLRTAKLLGADDALLKLTPLNGVSSNDLRLLTVKKAALDRTKKVMLQKSDGDLPLLLTLPPAKSAASIKVSADSPVVQDTQALLVNAESAKNIKSIMLKKQMLHWEPVDESSVRLKSLKDDGVTNQQQSIDLTIAYINGDKATLHLDIVAARIAVKTTDKSATAEAPSASASP